ncbi:hypothetical protein [Paenibacillus sp. NPDC057934]|uniref:hypothetical protein n=1 Tax=Paenibacillus sp. NPDC057934 TaxID=3346282 RepID=UPI0036D7B136
MEQCKSMLGTQWQITEKGKLIQFADFLKESVQEGISSHYLADDIEATLDAGSAPDAHWMDVVDYIGPIAGWVLSEAIEVDRELYNKLVISLKDAYVQLRARSLTEQKADKVFTLDRDNVDFLDDLDNLIQILAEGEDAIKSVDRLSKGRYNITVGVTE